VILFLLTYFAVYGGAHAYAFIKVPRGVKPGTVPGRLKMRCYPPPEVTIIDIQTTG